MVLAAALASSACGGNAERPEQPAIVSATTLPSHADRPTPDGPVVRRCGSHYAAEFDKGVESRIVTAGPVSLLAFRVAPKPPEGAPVDTFKVMVRLTAGTEATLETLTEGTSLLYDRARFQESNVYQLSDGDTNVRFVGCPDQPALFNGAVLTTGPRSVALRVVANDVHTTTSITAYGS